MNESTEQPGAWLPQWGCVRDWHTLTEVLEDRGWEWVEEGGRVAKAGSLGAHRGDLEYAFFPRVRHSAHVYCWVNVGG